MTNILRNFAGAEEGTGEITDAAGKTKVSTAATEKNAMKSLLEGLDAQQKSVNQMPGTHDMAKNGAKHPASKYLVGGEHDDDGYDIVDAFKSDISAGETCPHCDGSGKTDDGNWYNEKPCKACDGTGKILDEARIGDWPPTAGTPGNDQFLTPDHEQATNDEWTNSPVIKPGVNVHIGHHVAGGSGIEGEVVKVEGADVYIKNPEGQTYKGQLKNTTVQEAVEDTYEDTIAKRTTGSDVHKKQSFKDIFRSMDETEDDMVSRFKKELHDEKTSKALSKGDNGKFNLAEGPGMSTANFESMAEDMKRLMAQGKTIRLVAKESHVSDKYKGEIFDYNLEIEGNLKEGNK